MIEKSVLKTLVKLVSMVTYLCIRDCYGYSYLWMHASMKFQELHLADSFFFYLPFLNKINIFDSNKRN